MTIQNDTIIQPIPTDELLAEKGRKWRLVLPTDYRNFIVNYNGGIPNEKSFECNKHNYAVTRFLCILKNVQETQNGWYDISVVESFAGDYVCLDYRKSKEKPSICIWSHEKSGDFDPVTYKVADTFSEFVEMLK